MQARTSERRYSTHASPVIKPHMCGLPIQEMALAAAATPRDVSPLPADQASTSVYMQLCCQLMRGNS